jgi:hypothetical protein
MIGGAIGAGLGIASLFFRTSYRRQRLELDRVDRELRALGVQARLSPWISPRISATSGMSAGLTASARF